MVIAEHRVIMAAWWIRKYSKGSALHSALWVERSSLIITYAWKNVKTSIWINRIL